jgi:hypothetical protein
MQGQENGEIQEYKAIKLQSDGICIVAYWDLRDAIAAYIKIKSEQNWMVQYCSQAYYSMVMSFSESRDVGN